MRRKRLFPVGGEAVGYKKKRTTSSVEGRSVPARPAQPQKYILGHKPLYITQKPNREVGHETPRQTHPSKPRKSLWVIFDHISADFDQFTLFSAEL